MYARASVDKEKSVDAQIEECVEFCEDEGFEVVAVLPENQRSASRYATKDRPRFVEAMEMMRSGTVDVLVTWENSRAQRDLKMYVALRDICEEFDVLWAYGGEVYDMNDPADRKATAQDAVNSESESDNISIRVTRGVRKRASSGLWHGPLQYGYKREYDPDTGKVVGQVLDPETAPIVRELVERLLAGHSVTAIWKDLNARGIPCSRSGEWCASKIRAVVLSPVIAGFRQYKGRLIKAQWPEIVTEAERETLVALLTDPARRTNKDGTRVKHLLSGIALCGVCGSPVGRGRAATYPSYICRANRCVVRNQARADEYVEEALLTALESPDAADIFRIEPGDEVARALEKAKELRARLKTFYRRAAMGEISDGGIAEIEAQLLPEIEKAEKHAKQASLPPVLAGVVGSNARAAWKALDIVQRRAVIRAVMQPRILRVGKGARGPGRIGIDPGFFEFDNGPIAELAA
ncbi:recombinase family protein [Saccharopolyspora hattusasensis]|uniref:recombinase family protein n=1 Tax=Saccharopolyspora hattusasensis TaxID=1128679 RepID=UPI003D9922D1